MTCASCVAKIETALRGRKGVDSAAVALIGGKARVAYRPQIIGPRDIVNAIEVIASLPFPSSPG